MQARGKATFRGVDRDSESYYKLELVIYRRNYCGLRIRIIEIKNTDYNSSGKSF